MGETAVPPHTFTVPQLIYPSDDLDESIAPFNSASVSIKRDLAEIGILADTTWQNRYETAPRHRYHGSTAAVLADW